MIFASDFSFAFLSRSILRHLLKHFIFSLSLSLSLSPIPSSFSDTRGGSFGDGESKVVRNLTKPPMVSSLIEFVTCMHARKLRPEDTRILDGNNGDIDSIGEDESPPGEGYIVVSRAVTGGKWSGSTAADDRGSKGKNGERLVRNEILLGVNVLRSIPGDPNKTEMTSVTHVYSPMIPAMLARGAGVKGAVDFVRDIRTLP